MRRGVSKLIGLALLTAGCGAVATPTVVEQAAARLESREATHLTTVRPRLMREARTHLQRARRAVLEEDADAAELYGHLALQRYETAAGFTHRDLVQARMGAMDAALGRITESADALAAERAALLKVKAAEDRLAALDRARDGESAERKASRKRLVEARQRQAQAVAVGAARRAPGPFGAGQALLESGLEALEGDLFAEAREAAAGAIARFDEAIARSREVAAEEKASAAEDAQAAEKQAAEREAARDAVTAAELARAEALGRGLDRRDRPRFEKGAALVDLARRMLADDRLSDARGRALEAVAVLSPRADEPAAAAGPTAGPNTGIGGDAAAAAIVEARTRRATALGQGRDRRCPDVFRGVDALIELAEDRQQAGAAAEALTAATRAQERLETCDAAPTPTDEALQSVRPAERTEAETRIAEAQQALARARAARVDPAQLEAGAGLIVDARGWYATAAYDRAGALAIQARDMLNTALPAAGTPDPALAEARAALARSRALGSRNAGRDDDPLYGAAQAMEAEAERLLGAGRGDEALRVANQAAAAWLAIAPKAPEESEAAPPPEDWRPAYREILATLTLRDRADAMAGPAARGAVDSGDRSLAEAREAYQKRDYGTARRATALAAASYRQAIDGSAPPPPPARTAPVAEAAQPGLKAAEPPPEKPEKTAKPESAPADDTAARDAELQAAEARAAREALERAAAERAAAEKQAADAESAARAEAERELKAAREAEAAAKAALAAAQADAEARERAEAAAEKRRAEARSWLDGARKRQVECLRDGCDAKDPVAWGRVEEALRAAESAMQDGALDATVDAASRAIELMDAIAAKPMPFTVPADQGEVRREGDRLRLRTRLRFRPSKATLRPGAEQTLDALARTITENAATIERVRLVGFTDDSGPADRNLELSRARAEAVRDALVARGVSADTLAAEGRGEAEPAFDNRTAEGRRKNRRVEIRLELREGDR